MFPRNFVPRVVLLLGASLLPLTLAAAPAPEKFAGIEWGSTRSQARTAMVQRGATPGREKGEFMNFDGGTFNGHAVNSWELHFENGGLDRGLVRFPGGSEVEALFRKIKAELNTKYGTASDEQVGHRLPGHFVLGLGWRMSGAIAPKLHAEWSAESLLAKRGVEIHLWVDGGQVHLAYQHLELSKAPPALEQKPAKKSDL